MGKDRKGERWKRREGGRQSERVADGKQFALESSLIDIIVSLIPPPTPQKIGEIHIWRDY